MRDRTLLNLGSIVQQSLLTTIIRNPPHCRQSVHLTLEMPLWPCPNLQNPCLRIGIGPSFLNTAKVKLLRQPCFEVKLGKELLWFGVSYETTSAIQKLEVSDSGSKGDRVG